MPTGGRLSRLLLILAMVGAPAVALRAFCVGRTCDAAGAAGEPIPFCGLPAELRRAIAAGFRQGRSPDVMVATGTPDARVPLAFLGDGIGAGQIPEGVALDSIAPTLEGITGLRREHPEVRTGDAIVGLAAGDRPPPLVVVIAWKGVGTPDLERAPGAWPFLRTVMRKGAGTLNAVTGSSPIDPAATLTTIGSGALPSSHGITGKLVREENGEVARAWTTPEAGSVIASFADDLDHDSAERARIAAILTAPTDRGIVGNGWYLDARDDDRVIVTRGARADDARATAESARLGADAITDFLGVVLDDRIARADSATRDVVAAIRDLVPGSVFVIAGTGTTRGAVSIRPAQLHAGADASLGADAVQAVASDGLFLDRNALVERSITSQRVADALMQERSSKGTPLFTDAYPSFAVAFARYC